MSNNKPRLRPAPSAEALAHQQEAAARLLKLDEWTSEPLDPPASAVAPQPVMRVQAAEDLSMVEAAPADPALVVPAPLAVGPGPTPVTPGAQQKPWEVVSEDARHTYHIVCSERLFQKMDYVWKRQGYASMRAWVLKTLEECADQELKDMGAL